MKKSSPLFIVSKLSHSSHYILLQAYLMNLFNGLKLTVSRLTITQIYASITFIYQIMLLAEFRRLVLGV